MANVLVVGAGISGLATSLVLSRQGHAVELVERAREIRAVGSGIGLIGPAVRALERLGVLDDCLAHGFGAPVIQFFDRDGRENQRIALPSPAGMPDAPGLLGIARSVLHRILLDRALAEGIDARTGTEPTAISDHGDGDVAVTFGDRRTATYDLVVGADGVHSAVRGMVFGPREITFQDMGCYRVMLPRPDWVEGQAQFLGDTGTMVGLNPTEAERMYLYCNVPATDTRRPAPGDLAALLRGHLAAFPGLARQSEQITADGELLYTPFETILVEAPWVRGRTVLVGDAAHCPTPHLAAGGAMCLEDAVVLGEELAGAPTLDAGLAAWAGRRYERCRFVVDTSVSQAHEPPDAPGAEHAAALDRAFGRLAEMY